MKVREGGLRWVNVGVVKVGERITAFLQHLSVVADTEFTRGTYHGSRRQDARNPTVEALFG